MSDIIRKKNQWYPDHKIIPKKTSAELAEDVEAFLNNGGDIQHVEPSQTGQPADRKLTKEENRHLQKTTFKVGSHE